MILRPALGALLLAVTLVTAPSAAAAAPALHVDLGGGVGLDFVLVPAGTFVEGSPAGEKGREDGELQREVRLTEPYYLGKHLVTVGAFARFAAASGYRTEAERGSSGGFGWDGKTLVQRREFTWKNPGFPQTDDRPVTLVTYEDALAFTAWLSRGQGRAFTLPTEAQWEHAYRAGTHGPFYQGTTDRDALALGWFKENAGAGTHPVGQKKPNAFGLFDMAGDVFEWCLDWYAPYPPGPAVDPLRTQPDAADKPRRVLRGGSWLKDVSHGRAAARYRNTPGSRNADNGFRVVAGIAPSPPPAAPATVPLPASSPPEAPAPTPASQPGCGAMALGFGCMGTVLSALVLLVVLIVRSFVRTPRRAAAPAPAEPSPREVRFQVTTDGFHVLAPRTYAGCMLHYGYRGPTGPLEGQVALEPSEVGQFVYTGFMPVELVVVRLIAPARLASRPQAFVSQPVVHHVYRDEEPFHGYPPAY